MDKGTRKGSPSRRGEGREGGAERWLGNGSWALEMGGDKRWRRMVVVVSCIPKVWEALSGLY